MVLLRVGRAQAFNPSAQTAEGGGSLNVFKASLVHRTSSRAARATQKNPQNIPIVAHARAHPLLPKKEWVEILRG